MFFLIWLRKRVFRIHPHFSVFIPTGRAINPITKTNWEGVGIVPDVNVSAEQALKVAQTLAWTKLIEAGNDLRRKDMLHIRLMALTQEGIFIADTN